MNVRKLCLGRRREKGQIVGCEVESERIEESESTLGERGERGRMDKEWVWGLRGGV